MSINFTEPVPVQLCAEDRHRLDTIITALAALLEQGRTADTPFAPLTEALQEPTGAQNEAPDTEPAEPEKAPWAEAEPAPEVKLADIQRKVVDLSTAGKKDAVKAIIQAYAPKVSAIPEDKLPEVWAKLTKLEG